MNQTQNHPASRAAMCAAEGSRAVSGLNLPDGHMSQMAQAGHMGQMPQASHVSQAGPDPMARWRDAVHAFLQTVDPDLESLEERLEQLKEEVAGRLQPLALSEGSVDTRLVLELDVDGTLRRVGTPAAEGEAAKAASGGLAGSGDTDADAATQQAQSPADEETEQLMRALAVESALIRCVEELRGINSLLRENRAARSRKACSPSESEAHFTQGVPPYPAYNVCLKGELSHFYFPRS